MQCTILIMYAIAENEKDLEFVMVANLDGEEDSPRVKVSPVMTLEGGVDSCDGNPYLVYGPAVTKFVGRNKFFTSISVFKCTSGGFQYWNR